IVRLVKRFVDVDDLVEERDDSPEVLNVLRDPSVVRCALRWWVAQAVAGVGGDSLTADQSVDVEAALRQPGDDCAVGVGPGAPIVLLGVAGTGPRAEHEIEP